LTHLFLISGNRLIQPLGYDLGYVLDGYLADICIGGVVQHVIQKGQPTTSIPALQKKDYIPQRSRLPK